MNLDELCAIFERNNVPRDARFIGDLGFETDLECVWYNRERNEVAFTDGGFGIERTKYAKKPGWELISGAGSAPEFRL